VLTHDRYFAKLPDLLAVMSLCLDAWRRPNPVLRCLCCAI